MGNTDDITSNCTAEITNMETVSQLGTAMMDYAVIIWVYSRKGTASSVTLLTVCTFLPTSFFRFLAGSMVDRLNKKRIMLIADLLAACGTLAVFVLHSGEILQIWHLYVINFLAKLGNDGMLSPFILGRTDNNQSVLGMVESFTAMGVLAGSLLADTVFEPFMGTDSAIQRMLSGFFGTGKGSGIGLMFFIVGIAGMAVSFTRLRKPVYRELDRAETEP